jgi:hypothetical protein
MVKLLFMIPVDLRKDNAIKPFAKRCKPKQTWGMHVWRWSGEIVRKALAIASKKFHPHLKSLA